MECVSIMLWSIRQVSVVLPHTMTQCQPTLVMQYGSVVFLFRIYLFRLQATKYSRMSIAVIVFWDIYCFGFRTSFKEQKDEQQWQSCAIIPAIFAIVIVWIVVAGGKWKLHGGCLCECFSVMWTCPSVFIGNFTLIRGCLLKLGIGLLICFCSLFALWS